MNLNEIVYVVHTTPSRKFVPLLESGRRMSAVSCSVLVHGFCESQAPVLDIPLPLAIASFRQLSDGMFILPLYPRYVGDEETAKDKEYEWNQQSLAEVKTKHRRCIIPSRRSVLAGVGSSVYHAVDSRSTIEEV